GPIIPSFWLQALDCIAGAPTNWNAGSMRLWPFSAKECRESVQERALKSDREKWDVRHSKEAGAFPAPDEFLVNHEEILRSGRALDVAAGRGGNSIFLAERGYGIDAVDISFQALLQL